MIRKHSLLFGAHMSIAGGFEKAIERGESIGCTAIQIFTKNNRQWDAKPLLAEECTLFKDTQKKSSVRSIIAHASYLINIGSDKKNIEEKSIDALIIEIQRCHDLNIPYLVLHPGSYGESNEKACLTQISHNLNTVLQSTKKITTTILLETMAGQGSNVCYTFEQIAELIHNSHDPQRIAVCFDTCHAFAAGYEFSTQKQYNELWNNFDSIIGLKKLKAMHINDSEKALGSYVDRHMHIGKGKIGLEAFSLLFNDPQFFDIPKILETPKKDIIEDKKNMETIYSLITSETKKVLRLNI